MLGALHPRVRYVPKKNPRLAWGTSPAPAERAQQPPDTAADPAAAGLLESKAGQPAEPTSFRHALGVTLTRRGDPDGHGGPAVDGTHDGRTYARVYSTSAAAQAALAQEYSSFAGHTYLSYQQQVAARPTPPSIPAKGQVSNFAMAIVGSQQLALSGAPPDSDGIGDYTGPRKPRQRTGSRMGKHGNSLAHSTGLPHDGWPGSPEAERDGARYRNQIRRRLGTTFGAPLRPPTTPFGSTVARFRPDPNTRVPVHCTAPPKSQGRKGTVGVDSPSPGHTQSQETDKLVWERTHKTYNQAIRREHQKAKVKAGMAPAKAGASAAVPAHVHGADPGAPHNRVLPRRLFY